MFSLKKRHVVVAGILIGFGIAYQDQIATLWNRWQGVSARQESKSNPIPNWQEDWGANDSNHSSSDRLSHLSNRSLPEAANAPVHPVPVHAPSSQRMVSTSASNLVNKVNPTNERIRIASFNLHGFGESKLRKAAVVEMVVRILRQFDVVAIQHIQSKQQYVLPELLDRLNQADRRFDYCIGPRVGSEGNQQQFAFLFDTDRIETDRQMLYTVDDPQGLMEFEPLVGWFRVRGIPSDRAFTFSLINVRVDPLHAEQERKHLTDLIRSVRQDGRNEDDLLVAGDFGCSNRELSNIQNNGVQFAIEDTPTTVTGEEMLDNIVFPSRATDEFTGKSGVVDFLRAGNLSIDQALQISLHMPVWAEFFVEEGGRYGYVGSRP